MENIALVIAWCAILLISLFIAGVGIWLLTMTIKHGADKRTKIIGTIASIIIIIAGILLSGGCVYTIFTIL